MADLSVTAASVLASAAAVIRREYTAGATITAGQTVYLNASNQWALMDANPGGLGSAVGDLRGIALNGASLGQPMAVCTSDTAFTPGATLTVGQTYVQSANVGNIAPISDLASTDLPIVLFIAKTTAVANMQPFTGGVAKP